MAGGVTPTRVTANDLSFTVKPDGEFDATPLVHIADWTIPAEDDADPVFVAYPSFDTAAINDLFAVNDDPSDDVASVTLMAEINWRFDSGPIASTDNFRLTCINDILRPDDIIPTPLDPPDAYERKSNRGEPDGYASLNASAVVVGVPVQLNLGFPFAPAGGERDAVLIAQSAEFAAAGHTVIISGAPAVAVDFELLLNDALIGTITTSEGTSAVTLDAAVTTGTGLSEFELVAPAAVIAAPFSITLLLKGLTV